VADRARTLEEGLSIAAKTIDSGAADRTLQRLAEISQGKS
jgi:anthranilate phosphoribosyltransferase